MRSLLLVLLVTACGGSSDPVTGDAAHATDARPTTHDAPGTGDADPVADAPGGAIDAALDAPAIGPDAGVTLDAGDAPGCTIAGSLGTVSPRAPTVTRDPGPPEELKYADPLNGDPKPDIFKLVLISGRGALAGGIAPGTYQLTGAETKYATCGACVEVFSDVDSSNNFAAFFLAQSGTLTISQVSPRLVGTLTSATLIHLNDDDSVADACTTHIDSLAFDIAVP